MLIIEGSNVHGCVHGFFDQNGFAFDGKRMMIFNRIDNRNKMVKSAIFFYVVGCGILPLTFTNPNIVLLLLQI